MDATPSICSICSLEVREFWPTKFCIGCHRFARSARCRDGRFYEGRAFADQDRERSVSVAVAVAVAKIVLKVASLLSHVEIQGEILLKITRRTIGQDSIFPKTCLLQSDITDPACTISGDVVD